MPGNVFGTPTMEAAPAAPATDPSPTDELVTRAADAAKRRAAMGANGMSTFLTGPLGVPGGDNASTASNAPKLEGK